MSDEIARLLLVGTDAAQLERLAGALSVHGYACATAATADAAVEEFGRTSIDLAVVELHLPDRDGVALAQGLKACAGADEYFPVMLIVARDEDRVRAYQGGCDDVMSEPVNLDELVLRVGSLMARRAQHNALVAANAQLRELQVKKQGLAALVVHDLRNPLSAIQGNIELMLEDAEEESPYLLDSLSDCHKLAGRALSLVAGLLDVEEFSEGILRLNRQPVQVLDVVQASRRHHDATVKMRRLNLSFDVPDGLEANMDPDIIGRVVENLLDNSVRYALPGGKVRVLAERVGDALEIRVGNDGAAVPEDERPQIFGRYYQLEARRAGARANRGLGLFFCKLAVEAHGGTIEVTETPELPACFVLRLPQ